VLFKKIIAVYSENDMELQDLELPMVKAGGTYSYYCTFGPLGGRGTHVVCMGWHIFLNEIWAQKKIHFLVGTLLDIPRVA
jgi:hypothetical protein